MYCPFCGERALGTEARACPRCGAELWPPPVVTGAVVGDGGERAMGALARRATLEWVLSNKGRLALYGAGVAIALIAFTVAVITVIAALVALVAALAPVMIGYRHVGIGVATA